MHTTDLDRMVDFYTRVMGFVVSDSGTDSSGARVAFMTPEPGMSPPVRVAVRRAAEGPRLQSGEPDLSSGSNSLDTLKAYRQALLKEGITQRRITDHGNAWALYFKDPEGNPVELYVDFALLPPSPCGEPLDLDQPNDEIPAADGSDVQRRPRFMSREAWMQRPPGPVDAR